MDCPGSCRLDAEKAATIRHGVRAMARSTTVPWCTIIVRNSFGVAGVVHHRRTGSRCAMRGFGLLGSLRWKGIEAAYRADIDAAEDPKASCKRSRTVQQTALAVSFAERFWVEKSSIRARPARCCANCATGRAGPHSGAGDWLAIRP